ncbi:FAD/NAD(P)-binding protein [Arthrobacter sp. Sa2CUA1]|uniref:FAD/NAD(P)-binding protein n=1 Tax=Arthrobacter gallicola TaxID=2762225 RepID=A0ABR8UQA3_9MICC|nr:FAD/NAD(P)-binding protein [Arthrobacter gallicola]MBD7994744.1 FAD/NAD(P)-binding protein [Arthrobacter gallicola]
MPVTNTLAQPPGGTSKTVIFIGGGPRAAMVLERLAANRAGLFSGRLAVHVVEPHAPGSGRIWRQDQSPLLKLNSRAADVTMFTDDSVECAGPAVAGPSLVQWAAGVVDGSITDVPVPTEELARQLAGLRPETFPTRQLQSMYLEWFFRRTVRALGPQVPVTVHRDHAVEVTAEGNGYLVRLDSGAQLRGDAVVVAVGHTDSVPEPASTRFAGFAARHKLFHTPPAYTNDVDFSALQPGQEAIVSGMGLAFVDLMVLLMEGRGGRFAEAPGGALRYLPSGKEPVLWAGSRRGVPYRSKISAELSGDPPGPPRYLTAGAVAALHEQHGGLDFRQHLWPLLAKDAAFGYYRELFTGHPGRVTLPWSAFVPRFDAVPWYSDERRRLVNQAVPRAADRLEFEELDHPLAGMAFAGPGDMQAAVSTHIREDLRLRDGGANSETLGLFLALLGVYFELGRLVPMDLLTPSSRRQVSGWWHGFFSYVDSGPPASRLREMLALHDAGYLRFLGPALQVDTDEARGLFTASSPQTGHTVAAAALIEARLPPPAVAGSANPLLRTLHESGLGAEEHTGAGPAAAGTGKLLVDSRARLVGADGGTRPGLYAVGPATSGWGGGAFARPNSNAAPFRDSDALARQILTDVAAPASAAADELSRTRLGAAVNLLHSSLA